MPFQCQIPVNKPLSSPFKTLSVKKDNIHLLNDYLENLIDSYISSSDKKAFVWS